MKTKSESKNREKHQTADDVWELRLYVAGQTPKSIEAFANLKKICEENLKGKYRIEVIDLLKNPQLAKGDQILGHSDAGEEASPADQENHRGSLQHLNGFLWASTSGRTPETDG